MDPIGASLVVARFAQFAASMLLFGALSFRLFFDAGFAAAPEIGDRFDRWLRPVLVVASAVALAAGVAWLDIEAAAMGNGWADAVNAATLSAVLFQTMFGTVWIWHLALAAALLAAILIVPPGAAGGVARIGFLTALAAALLVSTAWAGHAVMNSGAAGIVHLAAQVVHLLAAGSWLGSLPALGYVLYQAKGGRAPAWRATVHTILPRYSRAGYVAVGLILITGCINSWFLVGSVHALIATEYGRVLVAKLCLVALMIAIALVNRFDLAPQVTGPNAGAAVAHRPLARLWRNVLIEQLLALAVLAVVSVLGTLPPAFTG